MDKLNVKVEYIYNSGYTIETENHFLVIDYYKGDLNLKNKNTTFLVTHGHEDHYNKDIFNYKDRAKYIISDDIKGLEEKENLILIHPGEKKEFNGIKIQAFDSTDEGSSFFINVDGVNIFHSGDLNWWAWEDQGPKREEEREKEYCSEIDKLKSLNENIHIAFVPLDPRLKHNYDLASKYFINTIKPQYYFPMHFGDNFDTTKNFKESFTQESTKIFTVDKRGQVFEL